jgi:hypothetical protein
MAFGDLGYSNMVLRHLVRQTKLGRRVNDRQAKACEPELRGLRRCLWQLQDIQARGQAACSECALVTQTLNPKAGVDAP